MAITQNHVINIQPGVSAPLVIHCSQGDTGTQINLIVVNGDEEFDCSSYACSVHGVRSDGGNWGPVTCTVSGSTVCFSLTSAMTAVAGACLAEISVGTVGTANFAMLMENAIFENGVTYSNDVSVYQNILNAVQAGLSLAEAAVTNEKNERIAAVSTEATARADADTTLQNNIDAEAAARASADSNLQSQINQIVAPSGEAPSAAEVQNARIGADGVTYDTLGTAIRTQVNDIKEDIGIYYKNGYDVEGKLAEIRYVGYAWDGNPMQKIESSYMKCIEVSVKPNELYSFDLQIGNNWTGIAFVDAKNNIIKSYIKQKDWQNYINYRAKAPEGSVKALINSNNKGPLVVRSLTNRKYKYILPSYYRTHLDDKINEINSAIAKDEPQDYYGVGYIFVTDIHAPANTWTFLPLVERIRALTNAKMLINCGDNVRALGTKEDLISDLHEVMNKTYSVFGEKMVYALGNHDFIISDSDTWGVNTKQIAKALNYQINLSPLGVVTRKHYYYRDDDVGMIRNIILDYLDVDKKWFIEWLRDTIRNTPTDYHLAFYMHWNIFEQNGDISNQKYQYIVDWLSAIQGKTLFSKTITTTYGDVVINEDYTNTTHAICYFASGHRHKDYMHVVNGVTYFVSDCCANYNDNGVVNRVSGTTTDTAFDVICVNVKNRSVKLVRVGAGSNREWTY